MASQCPVFDKSDGLHSLGMVMNCFEAEVSRLFKEFKSRTPRGFHGCNIDTLKEQICDSATRVFVSFQSGLLNAVSSPIVLTDANGIITFANIAAGRTLGWDMNELVGKSIQFSSPITALLHRTSC